MSKRKPPPPQNDQDKALNRRNLIIASIVGITIILTFLIELPQKISATFDLFRVTETFTPTQTIVSLPLHTESPTQINPLLTATSQSPTPKTTDMNQPLVTITPTETSNVSPPLNDATICQTNISCYLRDTGHNTDQACKDIIALPTPYLVSQIYIEMTQKGLKEYGYSIWEVEAFRNNQKLYLKGIATASSLEAFSFDGCKGAQCAIDNNITTRWGSDYKNDPGLMQWLDIVLSEPLIIDRIELEWQDAYAKNYCIILH